MKRTAKSLLKRIHNLQSDIYDFKDKLKEKGMQKESELAIESGFELDISWQKMEDLLKILSHE